MKIDSKELYRASLVVLDELMDAEEDSKEEVALDMLAEAIEEYEDIHYSMD